MGQRTSREAQSGRSHAYSSSRRRAAGTSLAALVLAILPATPTPGVAVGAVAQTAPASAASAPVPADFSAPIFSPAGQPTSLAAADLDGDGYADLAVTGTGPAGVAVLPGNGSGFFPTVLPNPLTGTPSSVLVDQLDQDGQPDLAVTDTDGNRVAVLLGNGNGSFVFRSSTPVGDAPDSVASGDLDGDSITDLATSNARSGDVSVLLGQGDGTFQAQASVPVGANPSGDDVADFDGDGHLDVVTSNADDGSVSVLLGQGDGTFRQPSDTYPAGSSPSSVTAGDLNDDGVSDLAVTDSGADRVALLFGAGDGTFTGPTYVTLNDGAQDPVAVAESDLNGDGHLDLAAGSANGVVSLMLGDGTGLFTTTAPLNTGSTLSWLVTADIDADERPDLVASTATGLTVFLNATPFPPTTARTQPAKNACGRQVTLTGELHATAYRTRWHFEWWYPHRRHHRTPVSSVPPDDDPQHVSAAMRHLRAGGTVHYRLVAVSHHTRMAGKEQSAHCHRRSPAAAPRPFTTADADPSELVANKVATHEIDASPAEPLPRP